jgi:hypothetical protein
MIERRGWVPCLFFGIIPLATLLLPIPASAQRQGDPQSQTPPSNQPAQKPREADPVATPQPQPAQTRADDGSRKNQGQAEGTTPKNDRLFGVLPNYLTVENAAKVPPLTSGGKFKLVAKNAFDPVIFPFIGFIALVNQGQDSDPGFGQGASGFGKRYGASFADATIGSFMTGAIFPSVLKQDPRYYQLVRGGFRRRLVYSITRIVITRADSGHNQFNGSELAGNFVAAGISNAYHPASDRSFKNTLSGWGNDTGWDMMANIAQEFWPDIHVWLKKKFASGRHP